MRWSIDMSWLLGLHAITGKKTNIRYARITVAVNGDDIIKGRIYKWMGWSNLMS